MSTHLEHLEALDTRLADCLSRQPDLTRILRLRFKDQFPRLNLLPEQVMIGERTLPDVIAARLQAPHLALPMPPAAPFPQDLWPTLQRFIERFCEQLPRLLPDYHTRFWMSEAATLQTLRLAQLRSEIALREQDRTLPASAIALLQRVLAHPDASARDALPASRRPGVYELHVRSAEQAVVLPCAFVLTQRDARGHPDPFGAFSVPPRTRPHTVEPSANAGIAVLYTLGFGLESFACLADLHQELTERLDDERQGRALLCGLAGADLELALNPDALLLVETFLPLVERGVQALIARQRDNLDEAMRAPVGAQDFAALHQRLAAAAQLLPLIDSKACLRTRYAALLEKHMPNWLKHSTNAHKIQLVQSMHHLALAVAKAAAPGVPSVVEYGQRDTLLAYARRQLLRDLRAVTGEDIDPDHIFISTTTAHQTGPLTVPTNPGSSIPGRAIDSTGPTLTLAGQRRTLTELALENVSYLDPTYWLTARVTRLSGELPATLTPSVLKGLVRRLNIGAHYPQYLRERLLHGPESEWRREAHRNLTQARLHAEALKAHHAKHLLPDRNHRGYQWINTVLQHPDSQTRPTVEGHVLQVSQLLLGGATVAGAWVVAPAAPHSVAALLLYTPDAPDRRAWREYPSRQALAGAWRADKALRTYLAQRVALGERERVKRLLEQANLAKLIDTQVIEGDFISQAYTAEVRQAIANSDALSTSTAESNRHLVWDSAVNLLELINVVLPAKVMLPLALARALWSCWNGIESFIEQHRDESLKHFMVMIAQLTDAGAAAVGTTFMARTLRRINLKPPMPINPQYAVSEALTSLRYRIDGQYQEGVYERRSADGGPSEYFMTDLHGRSYQVLFEGDKWTVRDARNPEAYFPSLIRRNSAGELELVSDVRWQGQTPDIQALMHRAALPHHALPEGTANAHGLLQVGNARYLRLGPYVFSVRQSLRAGRYLLLIPAERLQPLKATVLLQRNAQDSGWEVKVRQAGMVSEWLAFEVAAT